MSWTIHLRLFCPWMGSVPFESVSPISWLPPRLTIMLTSCPSDPILDSNTRNYLDCTSLWIGKMTVVWKFYHNLSFVRWSSLPIHSKKANISVVSAHTSEKVGSDILNTLKSDNCYMLVTPKHRSSHFTQLLLLKDSLVQKWLSGVKDEY